MMEAYRSPPRASRLAGPLSAGSPAAQASHAKQAGHTQGHHGAGWDGHGLQASARQRARTAPPAIPGQALWLMVSG
eukprot:scaffold105909_cov17-Tisochrysis_lutea.AAC.1